MKICINILLLILHNIIIDIEIILGSSAMINTDFSSHENDTIRPFTTIRLIGTFPEALTISYTIYGVCSSNTNYFFQKPIDNQLKIYPKCKPMGIGDKLVVNIVKPAGYNLRFHDQSKYNPPEIRNVVVEFSDNKSVDLIIHPCITMNLCYIDVSGESDKQKLICFLDAMLDSLIALEQKFIVYASNFRNPLIYHSKDYESDMESKHLFMNKIASLSPDPPFGSDDANLIYNMLFNSKRGHDYSRINVFFYSDTEIIESYNSILQSLIGILPMKNQGDIVLIIENYKKSSIVKKSTINKLRRNQISYMSF